MSLCTHAPWAISDRSCFAKPAYMLSLQALQAACGLVVKHRQTHFQQLWNVQTASWSQDGVCFVSGDATAYA